MFSIGNLTPPHLSVLQDALNFAQQQDALSKQGLQLGALRQTMPGQISAQNAQNQATTNTAVPIANANLGVDQARAPLMNAQTNQITQSTRLAPLTAAVQAQNSINMQNRMAQSGNRFGSSFQLSKMLQGMSPAARYTWQSQNQGLYNQMLAGLAAGNQTQESPHQSIISPSLLSGTLGKMYSVPQQEQLQAQPKQPQPSSNSGMLNGIPYTYPGLQNTGPMNGNDQQVARANQMEANKALTTTQQQNRYQAGVALEKFINDPAMNDQLSKMGTYSGLGGQLQKTFDMIGNNPRYTQYKSAVSQMAPILSGGISQLEGFAKTDKGLNEGLNYFKRAQDVLGNNPEQAQQYINTGKQILSAELASIKSSTQPLFNVNRSPSSPDIPSSPVSLAPSKPLNSTLSALPSFKSKQDFQNWYISLSPMQQQQVNAHLGGK